MWRGGVGNAEIHKAGRQKSRGETLAETDTDSPQTDSPPSLHL